MSALTYRLRGVDVRLGGHAVLRGLDFDVGPGERVALVGPSGAGKTTLLRLLNGVVPPHGGSVQADGREIGGLDGRALRAVRARVGFVHQDHSLVPNVRVVQNVLSGKLGQRGFWSALRGMVRPRPEDVERAWRLLERVGIGDKLYQRTDTLSGGQQQRVALVRALFQEPRALLADEPVASVDPARARDLLRLMTELADEHALTLVVSLHDLRLAREFFPRVVGLRAGRAVFDAPTAALGDGDFEALYRLEESDGA